jgi:(p)ppGpp synthase/HD superfamily hydrolase
MQNGYSDKINHALAFAAKHHDQRVRRGTHLPYATHAANTAIILTRYGRDDESVIAGILHNVVADYVGDGASRERLDERMGEKFGGDVLDTLMQIVGRRFDSDGVELSQEDREEDLLQRLALADDRSRWVCVADKLHSCGALLADLRRTEFRDAVWQRQRSGREETLSRLRSTYDRLSAVGFDAPIMAEYGRVIEELEHFPD